MAVTVVELIEVKEQELQMQEKSIDNLREQIRLLRAAQAAETGARATAGNGRPTVLEMAEVVLRRRRRPMPSKELCQVVQGEFGVRVTTHSMGTMLYRAAVERERVFFKDKKQKNTYGLLEWQKS